MPRAYYWGLMAGADNRLDGRRRNLVHQDCMPKLFTTRQKAIDYREQVYGYMRKRHDLKAEPHGWIYPRPVKIYINCPQIDKEMENK